MTSRAQFRFCSAPTGALQKRVGRPADVAMGGARPLVALALRLADKTCPEARFYLVSKMTGLRLRLSRGLSAGFVALGRETTGQLQTFVIVPN